MTAVYVAAAGALGALSRMGLQSLPGRQNWPWVTLAINVSGSLVLGFLLGLATSRISPEVRTAIGGGFLGAFTTFSTFAVETSDLIDDGRWQAAGLYVVASVVLGVAAAFLGTAAAQAIK